MELLWIIFAFVCGFAVTLLRLPPLIGFLAAGFALNFAGVELNATLETLANLGITLMLFTIGLKLNLQDLLSRAVLAGSVAHMGLWTLIIALAGVGLTVGGITLLTGLDPRGALLVAFALSFSSTVCAIKVLEDSGEQSTRHGNIAVGILVMQDVIAVVFLVATGGGLPSVWAPLLLGLYFARPLLRFILSRAGHGEMLPLTGFVLALGGYELFSAFGIKGDLGALVLGMLLTNHVKTVELAKSLLHFKDLFLIGFFLSVGLTALPDWSMLAMALGICALLPIKLLLFFGVLSAFRLRARTAYLTALVLGNYSEFGLIVVAASVGLGWLTGEWLVVLGLAVSFSFVLTSVAYRSAHIFYARNKSIFRRFQLTERLPEDVIEWPASAEILIVGTGRVGRGALLALDRLVGDRVWGMDANRDLVEQLRDTGMRVFRADGESADVWESIDPRKIRLALLAVPSVEDCRHIAEQLRLAGYAGPIAAIARYADEEAALVEAGIDKVFNFFHEAGVGFADDSLRLIEADGSRGEEPPPQAGTLAS